MGKQFYLTLLILCVVFWHGIKASSNRRRKNEKGSSSSSRSSREQIISHPENPPSGAHPYLHPNPHQNLDLNRPPHPAPNSPPNRYKLEIAAPSVVVAIADKSKLKVGYAINPFIVVTNAELVQEYGSIVVYSGLAFTQVGDPHNVINVRMNENHTKNNKLYDVAVLEVAEPIALEYPDPRAFEANVNFSPIAIEFACTMAKQLLEMRFGPEVPPHSQ